MTTAHIIVIVITLAIVLLAFRNYRRYRRLLRAIDNGIELLKSRDSSSRLAQTGDPLLNKVVDTFNTLSAELRSNRVKLREQNGLIDLLVEVSPMGIIMLDFDEHIVSMNPAARQFLECDAQAVGHTIGELTSPLAQRMSTLADGQSQTFTTGNAHIYKCTREHFFDRGARRPFFLIESLTEEVMTAERKAYEKVIRMIAHEVNNSTATFTSVLDMVDSDLGQLAEDTADMRQLLHVCSERSQEMTAFIGRLAEVVKIPDPLLQPVAVNSLVEANARFLESQCVAHGVGFALQLCEENPKVKADAGLMSQVLINIVKNAIESIVARREEDPGHAGRIGIATTARGILTVTDNGTGLTPDVEQRLFTPFFSTKPAGNGLGLLFIREVLTRHRASFSLKTEAGLTTFTIRFVKA